MKKLTLLVSFVLTAVFLAAGVAFAANIRCETPAEGEFSRCIGTENGDKITGSGGNDDVRARQGDDVVNGLGGDDFLRGGIGADRLFGGEGEETIYPYAFSGSGGLDTLRWADDSNDLIRGGPGGESITSGGQGGVDRIFGDGGNDVIGVDQRFYRAEGVETRVTREIVDCGGGTDQIFYDAGIDKVDRKTCEILNPTGPDGEPAGNGSAKRSARPELRF